MPYLVRKQPLFNVFLCVSDLAAERSTSQKLESQRLLLERQNKELKAKLADLETNQRTKTKATMAMLESKLANLEEQLDAETKERFAQQKLNRKLDKKVKDLSLQLEDKDRHVTQFKDQVDKANAKVKSLKQQVDELEEEISREKIAKRKARREMEDLTEAYENTTQELETWKNKFRYQCFHLPILLSP